jgi:hypothetical protein
MSERKDRSLGNLDDIGGFQPRERRAVNTPRKEPEGVTWPSREAQPVQPQSEPDASKEPEAQLGMRGPKRVIDRFKKMAKDDRYSQWAFLEVLMDRFEETGK